MYCSLVWFRRDLRLDDHAALHYALKAGGPVHCAFVFDTDILDQLADRADRRVAFIHSRVAELKAALERHGGGLHVLYGRPRTVIPALAERLGSAEVHANRDYEPFARRRDQAVAEALAARGRRLELHKDQVIFDTDEVLSAAGHPYHVFTPYQRAWLARLDAASLADYPVEPYLDRLAPPHPNPPPQAEEGGADLIPPLLAGEGRVGAMPSLASLGFHSVALDLASADAVWHAFQSRIDRYHEERDYPAQDATSHLSVHLRFGTLSIRELARFAIEQGGEGAQSWLSELIWREFYQMLLWHYPDTVEHAFLVKFDAIEWQNPPGHLEAWAEARTGYPIVDAAMRQLEQTGTMHNRLRMIAASFLVKDLHVDWRLGERHFATKLLDYDQAANVGGWQWCASTGTDAQPWFRVFNPVRQSERFDPDGAFIRRWLPELAGVPDRYLHAPWTLPAEQRARIDYPPPLVDHGRARATTLEIYKACR